MKDNCVFCKDIEDNASRYIELFGGWNLSHYIGPDELYLGRLILRTNLHRSSWGDLILEEYTSLGDNLKNINSCLMKYWEIEFSKDNLEQIHIAYLNENLIKKN